MATPDFIKSLNIPGTKLKETHIDYVVVGHKYAYKIKKPVRFEFVDFSSLKRRKHFCYEEVRLNRRYSPSVYLGVAPLRNEGKTVEYAVKMRAFPEKESLNEIIKRKKATNEMVIEIADYIWEFHKAAKIKGHREIGKILKTYEGDYKEIKKFIGKTISKKLYNRLIGFIKTFLRENKTLFEGRPIKDLHGDLHSDNIYYYKKPYLLDCIEFNPNFRQVDTAAEIAFFLMDLEYKGEKRMARVFLYRYLENSRDFEVIKLLNFYKCHYACVRGMVSSMTHDKKSAKKYFLLAKQYVERQNKLIAIGGLIGSGKSTLADKLSRKLGFPILRSDILRKRLAGAKPITHLDISFYKSQFTGKTYRRMFDEARKLILSNQGVILDASFSKKSLRKGLLALSKKTKAELFFIETSASFSTLLKRLKKRKNSVSDADPALLNNFIKDYEPPSEIETIK